MKRTCFNCKHYHSCLAEENPSQYHIHDYCDVFKTILSFNMNSEINEFLDNHWCMVCKASIGCNHSLYDDMETGEANCYLYKDADKEFWPDEKFESNKKHNIELAIKTLEYMFKKNEIWDEFNGTDITMYKLDEYYNENEIVYYRDLLERLKQLDVGKGE